MRSMAENPDTATLNSRNSASVLMPSLLMLSERDLEGELPSTACWKKPSTKVAKQLPGLKLPNTLLCFSFTGPRVAL